MDTKLLDDFLTLIEEGNLSRAASRRNVTQPAFSRRIRALEDWAGRPLLERRANGVVLDARIAESADAIRAALAGLDDLRQRLAGGPDRRLVCATQHALAASVFPRLCIAMGDTGRADGWRLRTLNRDEAVSAFIGGEADFLLIFEGRGFPPLPFDRSIVRKVWMHDTLLPVCGGGLRHRIGEDGLPDGVIPVLEYPLESHFGQLLTQSSAGAPLGAGRSRIVVQSAFSVALLELARAGMGVAWLPHSMARDDLARGDLVSLAGPLGRIPLDISLFAARRNEVAIEVLERLASNG